MCKGKCVKLAIISKPELRNNNAGFTADKAEIAQQHLFCRSVISCDEDPLFNHNSLPDLNFFCVYFTHYSGFIDLTHWIVLRTHYYHWVFDFSGETFSTVFDRII